MATNQSTYQTTRVDKLGLVLKGIRAVRRRLNLLVLQRLMFASLGLVLLCAATAVIAACLLGSAGFLWIAVAAVFALIVGLPVILYRTARGFVGEHRAAAIADQRADLNGRLSTLLSLRGSKPSQLWSFLLEDAVSRSEDYAPARIEPRWIAGSIWPFAAGCILAVVALGVVRAEQARERRMAEMAARAPHTIRANPLQLRPTDPTGDSNAEIDGDPEAMRQLAQQRGDGQEGDGQQSTSRLNQFSQRAQHLASRLQDRLTGKDRVKMPKTRIELAKLPGQPSEMTETPDSDSGKDHSDAKQGGNSPGPGEGGDSSQAQGSDNGQQQLPANSLSATQPMGRDDQEDKTANSGTPEEERSNESSSTLGVGSGAGTGSDPDHLYGKNDTPAGKEASFEILIDAHLSNHPTAAAGRGYAPPRVRTNLNSQQQPDQPMVRAEIPADDRDAIKRVFQR